MFHSETYFYFKLLKMFKSKITVLNKMIKMTSNVISKWSHESLNLSKETR